MKWAYHVTYSNRLATIAERGLLPIITTGGPQMARMGIVDFERGEVYFTEKDGIGYWYERAAIEGQKIAPPGVWGYIPVVLRVPMPKALEPDISGTDLAGADAWISHSAFAPREIWAWDGSMWRPMSAWDRIDENLALRSTAEGAPEFRELGYNPLANVR